MFLVRKEVGENKKKRSRFTPNNTVGSNPVCYSLVIRIRILSIKKMNPNFNLFTGSVGFILAESLKAILNFLLVIIKFHSESFKASTNLYTVVQEFHSQILG